MKGASILTAWAAPTGEDDGYRAAVAVAYPLRRCKDVTGQLAVSLLPAPNLFVVDVIVEDAVLEQIRADVDFVILEEWDV